MGIQVLPQQGSFASNLGAGLGSGLSQQLPEEIKRYRVKSGIENLGKQNIQDPYQLLAQLSALPIDAAEKSSLYSILQSQIGAQQALQGFPNQEPVVPGSPTGMPQTTPMNQTSDQGNEPKLTPLGKGAPTIEPVNELSNNLLRYQRLNYPTPQAATAEAERRLGNLEKEFDKQTASFLQKGPELAAGEVGGDVIDLMRQKAIQELARTGKSERSIVQKYARQAKEIAKDYSDLRAIRNDTGLVNRANEGTIKKIRDTGNRLTELGIPEDQLIDHIQTDLSVARGAAEYLLDPLYKTQAGKAMHSSKENRGIEAVKNTFSSPEVKLAEKIAPLMTSEDKIGSLAYIAQQKGLDSVKFIQELQRLIPQNIKDRLSTTQIRDLGNPYQLTPKITPLKQIWLMGFSGEKKMAAK